MEKPISQRKATPHFDDLPHPDDVKTIAVRLTNWVGDCVMNTPFLGRLRETFPKAHIVCLGRKNVVGLFRHHPWVDEIWEINDSQKRGFHEAASRLRKLKADVGFLLPNSIRTAALFAAGKVKIRVGYNRDLRRYLLTHPVTLRPEDLAVHEVKYYLRLLHLWQDKSLDPLPLKLEVTEEEKDSMRSFLESKGMSDDKMIVGVNPAALYGSAKRWLPDRYAQVGRHFVDKYGAHVVVTGLPEERGVAEVVCKEGGPGFYNAAGEMSLRELMAFLNRCNLYFTNDSGAMHIAAALYTPLIAVFGSTDWVTTAPLGEFSRIVRVETPCAPCILRHCPIDHRCMTGVTAEMVIEESERLLKDVETSKELV